MVDRNDISSWLDGGVRPDGDDSRLGLPASGRGSRATLGRRVPALFVDWFASMGVSYLFFDGSSWATLGVFAVENLLLVATLGSTLGHRLLGLVVRRVGSERPFVGLVPAALRAGLLCLVVPAVIWDRDGRGLHDKAAGTVLVRR